MADYLLNLYEYAIYMRQKSLYGIPIPMEFLIFDV